MYVIGPVPGRTGLLAIPVGLVPKAIVSRDGEPSLTAFSRGDELLMGGRWQSNGFAAAVVEQSFRVMQGKVLRRRADRLVTTDGVVRIESHTRRVSDGDPRRGGYSLKAVPLRKIREGDHIWALGRRDGPTGDLIASQIATRRRNR
jgi:hypothetical protein